MSPVFVTGGTGYVGRPLIQALLERGHTVHALARPSSAGKLPSGARVVIGNALDAATFAAAIPPARRSFISSGRRIQIHRRQRNSGESICPLFTKRPQPRGRLLSIILSTSALRIPLR